MRARHRRSFVEFIKDAWAVVEPGVVYTHGKHIEALCDHLMAVERGEVNRLLMNVPPGMMKSLTTSVFFPAYVWGPCGRPEARFLCTSHAQNLAIRDSTKMRRLVSSQWYRELYPHVILQDDQNAKTKFENTAMGFREAAAAGSITGSRGDFVIVDDPHSVESAASEQMRATTLEWFSEALPTRLNNPTESAIIIIMQRLHEQDVSGYCLEKQLGYTHLCLPMEYEEDRHCETEIGFSDWRSEPGELLFPERFTRAVVDRDKQVLGAYAYAGQFQQRPSPRSGGILKRTDWMLYDDDEARAQGLPNANTYPAFDYVIASVDTAYGEKSYEGDFSALTIWGVFQKGGASAKAILSSKGTRSELVEDRDTIPHVMLCYAWAKRLPIHGPEVMPLSGESDAQFKARARSEWGLCEWIAESCKKFRVDKLLIEAKASGLSVAQEMKRLYKTAPWSVELLNPGAYDKVARAYAVQATFTNGKVWAPDRDWAEQVITQCENFPRGKNDDLVDSTTQAIKFLREKGLLDRSEDIAARIQWESGLNNRTKQKPVYQV